MGSHKLSEIIDINQMGAFWRDKLNKAEQYVDIRQKVLKNLAKFPSRWDTRLGQMESKRGTKATSRLYAASICPITTWTRSRKIEENGNQYKAANDIQRLCVVGVDIAESICSEGKMLSKLLYRLQKNEYWDC